VRTDQRWEEEEIKKGRKEKERKREGKTKKNENVEKGK
jgi:hypothetical protein